MNTTPHRAHHSAAGARPPRVLHVVDLPGAGWDALAAAAHAARTEHADQRLVLIGDATAAADAAAVGLKPNYRLCPALGSLATAVGPFDRLFAQFAASWRPDVLHLWSDSARVLTRQTLGYRVTVTQADPSAHLPAFQFTPQQRAQCRAELGIAEHEAAVLLAADRPGVGDARRFAGLVGVLHLAHYHAVGLVSSRSDNHRRAARFLAGFDRQWDCIPLACPPVCVLAAADVVVYDQGDTLTADCGPGRLTGGIAVAAACAGTPVVTTDSALARRLLGPLHGQLCAAGGLMPQIARPLVPLCQDKVLRRSLGQALAAHAQGLCAQPGDLLARWRTAIAQSAPQPATEAAA